MLLPADLASFVLFLQPAHLSSIPSFRGWRCLRRSLPSECYKEPALPLFENFCDFAKKSLDAGLPSSQDKLTRKYKGGT